MNPSGFQTDSTRNPIGRCHGFHTDASYARTRRRPTRPDPTLDLLFVTPGCSNVVATTRGLAS